MYTAKEQFDNLSNYPETYTTTTSYNGRLCKKGAQILTVVAAYNIKHNKSFPNKDIAAIALVKGVLGATYQAYVYQSGGIRTI